MYNSNLINCFYNPVLKVFLLNLYRTALALSILFLVNGQMTAQADCSSAIVVCGNSQPFNPSGVGTKLEQLACGGIEHNSVWIAFQAKASGKLNFVIRPFTLAGLPTVVDVDWSLYQLAGAPGTTNCNNKTQLSCNFAGSSTVFGISGATGMATPPFTASQFNPGIDVTANTWYMLMVDQFSNTTPLLLSVQFTGNPEFPALNSTAGIFDDRPDFNITTVSGCSGTYNFTNASTAVSGIASYEWDFGDGSTSTAANPSHTYITTGTYYVTLRVTDNNGCKTDIRKAVMFNNTPPVMTAASIFATPSCSDVNNGSITVSTTGTTTPGVSGGTPPYTYELVSPSPMIRPSQSSPAFTGLQPGGYFVKATDACGKTSVSTVITVSQVATNTSIGLGIQNIQSACDGTPSGTATIFANGTTPPYTMALVNSSPVTVTAQPAVQRDPITGTYYTTFTGLLPGLYTVEAVDACGKERRATFTVNVSTAPTSNTVASPSCAGTPTGTLTVTATAATGLSANGSPGTFQYALINPSPILRSFQNSSVFESLYPGTYTVAVKDICGNLGTSTVTVGTAVAPNFGTSFTTASCPNGSTGTIEVQNGTTAGGGSPYTYELIAPSPVTMPVQNTNTFSNLPPGTYTVRMTDVCSTSAITTITVPASSAPTFTTATTTSCAASARGTITVTPGSSALGPFSFELISPGAAIRAPQGSNIANTFNSIFTNLNQGGYTVKMTDACGTSVTNSATIGAPTALAFPTGSAAVPSCGAPSSGQITVATPTTGLGAYMYELISPSPVIRAPQSSRIFNGLPPGNYTIRITDLCGTQVDNNATPLNLPTATAPTVTVTNTASCATASGTITCVPATANQGGGTYQYALIAPSPVTRPNQTLPIFTGLPAGAYTVQITDQCGITGTTTTTIAAAGAFTPAAGGSIVSCNGSGYNGQLIVTTPQNFTSGGPIPVGSGGGPYTYALYDATNTTLIAGPQSSNVFSTITPVAGSPSHTIRVTDACNNTSTTTGTINNPTALLAATISATSPSCASANTGVIKVTVQSTGGLPPLSYTLIDAVTAAVVSGPFTYTTFTNVPANATGYLVRTTDDCGNSVTSATALLFPAAVTPTASVVTTASCVTPSTGDITVTPGSGATLAGGTFTYALYDGTNTTLIRPTQNSPVFANVSANNYTVRITDRCGTIGTVLVTVPVSSAVPTATGTVSGTCSGSSTGVIRGASSGGILPITFSLIDQMTNTLVAGPQSDSIFSGLAIGTYIVRVTDACGVVTNSANIILGNQLTPPNITTTTALDCAGSAQIGSYGSGGSGGPYTYAICSGPACSSFGAFGSTSTFTVIVSGTYRIAVRDRCGNQSSSADININIPLKPTITGVTTNTSCGTTTINVAATGVPNTAFYSLDGSNFSTTIGSVAPGSHDIRVADNNAGTFGCASDPFTFFVGTNPVITNPTVTTGNAGVFFSQTFTQIGGFPPVAFTTSSTLPAGITLSSGGVLSGTPMVGGTFPISVNATDFNGCMGTSNYTLVITGAACVLTLTSAVGTNAQTVCINSPITNITYSNTTALGATGATFSGLPTGVTGVWAGDVVTISGIPSTSVGSPYNYTVTLVGGSCDGIIATGTITVIASPTTANAGLDQNICGTSATLAGNAPMVGTGTWSIVTGTGGSITTPSSPTSAFTGTAGTTYTLRWTIANAPCPASTDDVVITFTANPTTANAGLDQNICGTSATLAGNTPMVGTGTWSIVTGTGGSITTPSSPTSAFTGSAGTTYTLRWTIANAPCPASTDDVVITFTANPTTANAGLDQNICGTSATLAGNAPMVGTGTWSIVTGTGGSITTPSSATSAFTGTAGTTYTLRWTIANAPCPASTDDVVIAFTANPTTANAGLDQNICGTSATLAGNSPMVGTGTWSIVTGTGGSITTPSSPTSAFTGTVGTTYTLRWTIANAPCPASTDDVVITLTADPTAANAGLDQNICGTSATLAGNAPIVGIGTWSIVTGAGGSITTPSSPTSAFIGTAGTTYTLRWTIANAPCPASTDDVVITLTSDPTTADAGPDQNICGTSATLAANAPMIGTGTWSIVTGAGGTITTPSSPTSGFTGVAGTTYTLRWTIANAPCPASTDDIVITLTEGPTTADAGLDQNICGTVATLAANMPVVGTGSWSIVSGTGGSLVTPSSPSSGFTGTSGTTYTLRWTITNSGCPASTDDVIIAFVVDPTIANAGTDQTICGTAATLAANSPMIGTGSWSIVSGTGGSITTPSSPSSAFTGTAGTTYTLRWTIVNAPCAASTDDVIITFVGNPTTANAGPDQNICGISATLAANSPMIGTGTWSIVTGAGGTITTPSSPTSGFTGTLGTTYTLRWTIANAPCVSSTDDVVIILTEDPTAANAGPDQNLCSTSAILAANSPLIGTGSWSIVSGTGGSITTPTNASSGFTGTAGTTYTLRWTISNAPCTASTDDVVITFTASPTIANAGPDQNVCGTSATLAGNSPMTGTGSWSIVSGLGGSIVTPTSANSAFTGTAGITYTLRWTISNAPCPTSTDDVVIVFTEDPTTANAGPDQNICGASATLAANTPVIGTGSWSIVSGTGGSITTPTSPSSGFTGTAGNNYTLRWTISNAPCAASTDDVVINFSGGATIANSGPDQTICSTSATLAGNSPMIGTGSWSIVSGTGGSITTPTSPSSGFTGTAGTTYTLRWTIANPPCAASTDDVIITLTANPTVSVAGTDLNICGTSTTLAGNTPMIGSGSWTIESGVGGVLGDASSPTSSFSGTVGVIYTLRWTISNAPCVASTDDVLVSFSAAPSVADAGLDKTACLSPARATMTAAVPAVGSGVWSQVSGPVFANIISPNAPNTIITALNGVGTFTFRWTVSNNACPSNFDEVNVVVNSNPAGFTIAGGGNYCPTGTILEGPINPNYTYQWGKSYLTSPFTNVGSNQTLQVTSSGIYELVVFNQFGCATSATTVVNASDYIFTGSLAAGDAQQTGRLNRFAAISTCAAPKACPLTFTTTGGRFYDSYTITNPRSVPVCAVIGLNSGCGTAIFSVAYSNSFDPNSLCTNYLADPGSSPATSIFYEATIPANGTIVIVVHEVNPGQGCANYTLTVDVPRDLSAIIATPPSVNFNSTSVLTAPVANSYLWSPGGGTTRSITTAPITDTTEYKVTLGYGNNGCSRLDSVTVNLNCTPATISCPGNISLSNTPGICSRVVNYTTTAGGNPSPTVTYAFSGATSGSGSGDGSGSTFNVGVTTVVVTASNGCNSDSTCSFTVTISDTEPPVVTSGTIGSCYPTVAAAQAAALAATTATDNCPGALTEIPSTVGTCSAVITVMTTDAAGNSAQVTYNTRIDNTAPMVTVGTIATCYPSVAAAEAAALAATTASDDCPGALTEVASTVGTCSAVVTITTTDVCGNATAITYNTRIDNTPPALTCPANITVCGTVGVPAADISLVTGLTDNCPGAITVTHQGDVISGQSATVPYTITRTYRATDGCGNFTDCTQTILVNPIPNAVATPSAQIICSGNAITTIALTGNVSGTVYNWTRDNTVGVTGVGASGAGDISGMLVNVGNTPITVTFTITPSYTNGGGTCLGTSITATVIVNPTASVNAVQNQVVCNNLSTTLIQFVSPTTGGTITYNWTNNTPSIGLSANGTGNIPAFTAINTGTTPIIATITVTPSITNGGITCNGNPITFTITVNPLPTIFTVSGGGTKCTTDDGLAITLSGSQTGVNYQLQLNGGNVGAPVAGTGAALNFPVQSTAGTYTVVATNATTGCTSNMTGNAVILVITCGA
ncbi:MAG TPA: PKD domain-containing protein, partial [Saprospiraceae bacterium]|nr:PKD domain-containing protein [Saprospiraceae bacterium]